MAANKSSAMSAVKRAPAKTAASKAAQKKTAPSAPAKSATTTKATAKKATTKATSAKQATSAKTAAKKTTAKTPAKKTTAKTPAKKTPAKKTTAKKTTAKKTAARAATTKATAKKATATTTTSGGLAVREGEKNWSAAELKEVRATLEQDRERLITEIAATEEEISHLLREGGEGAGNDQADVGSNTFERDHEMSMAKNSRENLELVEGAIARIDKGTYGVCESCGGPIAKLRLQAFPRATLCLQCKQRQERR